MLKVSLTNLLTKSTPNKPDMLPCSLETKLVAKLKTPSELEKSKKPETL